MARICCPHCSEGIDLATTAPGRYQCPYCDEFFKISKKQSKPESVEIRTNTTQINIEDVVLPRTTMFWHNAKLVILTPPGFMLFVVGLFRWTRGDGGEFGGIFGIAFVSFGVLLMLPAFFNSWDLKNKKRKYVLKKANHILHDQNLASPPKSTLVKVLLALILLTIIGLAIYAVVMILLIFFLSAALAG